MSGAPISDLASVVAVLMLMLLLLLVLVLIPGRTGIGSVGPLPFRMVIVTGIVLVLQPFRRVRVLPFLAVSAVVLDYQLARLERRAPFQLPP